MITKFFVLGNTYLFSGDGEREYVHVLSGADGSNGADNHQNGRFRRFIDFLNRDLSGPSAPGNMPSYKISCFTDADRSKCGRELLIYGGNKPRFEVIDVGGVKIDDDNYIENCISVFNEAIRRWPALISDPNLARLDGLLKRIN